jgi:hypothetical protein
MKDSTAQHLNTTANINDGAEKQNKQKIEIDSEQKSAGSISVKAK